MRKLKKIKSFILIFFLLGFSTIYSQRNLQGKIVDESLTAFPGGSIYDTDFNLLGQADFDGIFEISIPIHIEELIITSIGYENSKITLIKDCDYIEFIMLEDGVYHYSARRVDKERRKRFDNIKYLHTLALKKDIFMNESLCYIQEFESYKPSLDVIEEELKFQRKKIKAAFKDLDIGDIVKIPFGIDKSENENEVSTYYSPCKNCTEEDYDFVIEGKVIKKYKRKLTLEIKITKMKDYDFLKYRGKILKINSSFKYEMKYYEVIIH